MTIDDVEFLTIFRQVKPKICQLERFLYEDLHNSVETRTPNLRIRNPLLYPVELQSFNRLCQIRTDDPALMRRNALTAELRAENGNGR